ncbi:nuclear transport factor 2 family protein [Flexibacterium corallicola]|uniref:nuclear transport factor 2 family protein n=1 Tax=Flexibacterium corallicola TaxID=3037259 RepID=UPI00286F2C9F|nr:nuclear transport factor 2 family protein [Pseudovibrio sp. M1P-2-3]
MTPDTITSVTKLMEDYFEGLYQADSNRLRQVFHPRLSYVCVTEGDELYLDLETYLSKVDKREPPAQRGEKRSDSILEISFGGVQMAHVKAQVSMLGRDYLDYLTLIRHGNGWRIVSKVFSYTPKEAE